MAVKDFYKRTGEVFAKLGTSPMSWKPCEILDWDYDGETEYPIWDRPTDYALAMTEFAEKELADKKKFDKWTHTEQGLIAMCHGAQPINYCWLCGHVIKNRYWIQHDGKKLVMQVGCECVENYPMADGNVTVKEHVKQKLAQYKDQQAIKQYWELREKLERIVFRFTKEKRWMPRWLWNCGAEMQKNRADTARKAKNFVKKYKVLVEQAAIEQSYDAWRMA